MGLCIEDPGRTTNIQDLEFISFLTEQSTKENGKGTCCMGLAILSTIMAGNGKDSIEMASFRV